MLDYVKPRLKIESVEIPQRMERGLRLLYQDLICQLVVNHSDGKGGVGALESFSVESWPGCCCFWATSVRRQLARSSKMRGFMGGENVIAIVDDCVLSDDIANLVKKEGEPIEWKFRSQREVIGVEAARVVYIGCGALESVSRAKLSLKTLLCYQTELGARFCNLALVQHCYVFPGSWKQY